MRLSEEIALGRMLLKPVPGTRFDGFGGGCAFGMAQAASGSKAMFAETAHQWLYIKHDVITLPCDCTSDRVVGSCMGLIPRFEQRDYCAAIVHVFNYHVCTVKDWTLDQLIDWIARVEPPEPPAPAEVSVEREAVAAK